MSIKQVVSINQERIDEVIDHYEGDADQQRVQLAKLLQSYGLDMRKPLLVSRDLDRDQRIFRQDPRGSIITVEDLTS